MVSSTPRNDGKSRPHRDSIPDRPARSQLLYRMSYPAHMVFIAVHYISSHKEPSELEDQPAITAFTPFMNFASQGQEIFKR